MDRFPIWPSLPELYSHQILYRELCTQPPSGLQIKPNLIKFTRLKTSRFTQPQNYKDICGCLAARTRGHKAQGLHIPGRILRVSLCPFPSNPTIPYSGWSTVNTRFKRKQAFICRSWFIAAVSCTIEGPATPKTGQRSSKSIKQTRIWGNN